MKSCSLFSRKLSQINKTVIPAVRNFLLITVAAAFTSSSAVNAQNYNGPSFLPNPILTLSTIPANGDVNPYGVAFVPVSQTPYSVLSPGDLLVSNFNNAQNLQGTGTTIIRITPAGQKYLFYEGSPSNPGLSTALAVLREGAVMVGSSPTLDGTCATALPGSLLLISQTGQLLQVITDQDVQGPWDMAVYNPGNGKFSAFLSNALTGNVVRFDMSIQGGKLQILNKAVIGSYQHRCDPATLFVAPTGLVYDQNKDILYVASTGDNSVFAISNALERSSDAGTGTLVYADQTHLHGALAMTVAPDGHLLVSDSDGLNQDPNQPSEIVEFTTDGQFVKQLSVDPNLGGSFGLNVYPGQFSSKFAAVDDNQNTISIWTVPTN